MPNLYFGHNEPSITVFNIFTVKLGFTSRLIFHSIPNRATTPLYNEQNQTSSKKKQWQREEVTSNIIDYESAKERIRVRSKINSLSKLTCIDFRKSSDTF